MVCYGMVRTTIHLFTVALNHLDICGDEPLLLTEILKQSAEYSQMFVNQGMTREDLMAQVCISPRLRTTLL